MVGADLSGMGGERGNQWGVTKIGWGCEICKLLWPWGEFHSWANVKGTGFERK